MKQTSIRYICVLLLGLAVGLMSPRPAGPEVLPTAKDGQDYVDMALFWDDYHRAAIAPIYENDQGSGKCFYSSATAELVCVIAIANKEKIAK